MSRVKGWAEFSPFAPGDTACAAAAAEGVPEIETPRPGVYNSPHTLAACFDSYFRGSSSVPSGSRRKNGEAGGWKYD